jgi:hypothetical protein
LAATRETAVARWRRARGASVAISVVCAVFSAPLPAPATAAAARGSGRAGQREPGVSRGQREAAGRRDRSGSQAIDEGARERRRDHGHAGQRADDEPRDAEAQAPAVVQVDQLERQDRAVAQHVQEDPDLDEPELAR